MLKRSSGLLPKVVVSGSVWGPVSWLSFSSELKTGQRKVVDLEEVEADQVCVRTSSLEDA